MSVDAHEDCVALTRLKVTALEIFGKLLTNYLYHPDLWVLYSVCSPLHIFRPQFRNKQVIRNVSVCKTLWLGGNEFRS
jgi:hypothetical protein